MKDPKSGFSLLEVLAAIMLTSLLISVFGQAFAIARHSNQIPGELFVAISKARMALSQARLSDPNETPSASALFHVNVELSKLNLTETPRKIPPPISSRDASQPPAPAPQLTLREVTVVVTAPSGRRTELNGVTSLTPSD